MWMQLDNVISLSRSTPPSHFAEDDSKPSNVLHYRVQFSVKPPSSAIFEGVVIEDEDTGGLTVLNDIERNNR